MCFDFFLLILLKNGIKYSEPLL